MKINRRTIVVMGAGFATSSLLPLNLLAQTDDGQSAEDIIKEFTGDRAPGASNFLWIDFAISISGEIITSMGKFSLL